MKRSVLLAALGLAVCVPTSHALAQQAVAPSSFVVLDVALIEATRANTAVDPVLQPFLRTLQATPFTGFNLVRQQRQGLQDGRSLQMDLGQGRRFDLTLLSHDPANARVRVRYVFPGGAPVDMTLKIVRGRAFLSVLQGDGSGKGMLLKVDVRS